MKKNYYSVLSSLLRTNKFYSTILRNSSLGLLFLMVFASSCKNVDELAGTTGVCPIVVSTNPAKNDTAVSVFTNVNATFNVAMDPSTINTTSFTLMQGSTMVPGVVTY